jgi:hypothetical protein
MKLKFGQIIAKDIQGQIFLIYIYLARQNKMHKLISIGLLRDNKFRAHDRLGIIISSVANISQNIGTKFGSGSWKVLTDAKNIWSTFFAGNGPRKIFLAIFEEAFE